MLDNEQEYGTDGGVPLSQPNAYNETNPLIKKHEEHVEDVNKYPISVRFIMLNEICERFSFYGLKAILALYLASPDYLNFSQDTATVIVHAFTMAAYTSTLLGGYISDSLLGKYRTILYVSMLYCVGSITLSITAAPEIIGSPPHWWGMALGLSLVALGTGGIKPVVSAFLGDQFVASQAHLLDHIFFLFYFCINLGSVLSTIITPLVRTAVSYAAAFGLPAFLLIVATGIFWAGRRRYRINPPTGSVLKVSVQIIGTALKKWITEGRGNRHWLDLARDHYPSQTVDDVRGALSVLLLFLPMPFFWALFDQSSSRWIYQAKEMNLHIGSLELQADQVPAVNPMLVLLFVPVFDKLVYPGLAKIRLPLSPLRRVGIGMVVTSFSFVCAAFVQISIDRGDKPHIIWQLPQYVLLTCAEIMVSVTCLEMAYTQAPNSMKSLIMAGWQMTVAIGNLVVIVVAETGFLPQWQEFLFFAGLMVMAALMYMVIAYHYKWVDVKEKLTK